MIADWCLHRGMNNGWSATDLGNIPASVVGAFLGMSDGLDGYTLTSSRSAICTWCPLNFCTATTILVVDIDTHFGGKGPAMEGVP